MITLIDTSLWIDFTRARSPRSLKEFIAPYILDPAAHLAEPIVFEVLRHATPEEHQQLTRQFETFPLLETPGEVWTRGVELGQACRQQGLTPGSLDLLIATLALHHQATLITFDDDFEKIAAVVDLRVKLLRRP
ncbi:MAG: type II toxin-antitoxin system VapC family toxin [Limisphaerales bacterium]